MCNRIIKRMLIIFFIISLFTAFICQTTAEAPSNFNEPNAGSVDNPFLISNLANFKWLADTIEFWNKRNADESETFKGYAFLQTADIDATDTQFWNSNTGFWPIGIFYDNHPSIYEFSGIYDGGGYSISNIYIKNNIISVPEMHIFIGLFGYTNNATIKNLHLIDINYPLVGDTSFGGGLVGMAWSTTIENCSVSGTFYGFVRNLGGLIGYAYNSIIKNSSANVIFTRCPSTTGGIVGISEGTTLENVFYRGEMKGFPFTDDIKDIGGIVGKGKNVSIDKAYSSFTSEDWAGGLVGRLEGNSTVRNCFVDDITGTIIPMLEYYPMYEYLFSFNYDNSILENNFVVSTEQMKIMETFTEYDWDFENTWSIDPTINDGYPYINEIITINPPEINYYSVFGKVIYRSQDGNNEYLPVKNATIKIKSTINDNITYTAETGTTGNFEIIEVPVGSYTITIQANNFKTYINNTPFEVINDNYTFTENFILKENEDRSGDADIVLSADISVYPNPARDSFISFSIKSNSKRSQDAVEVNIFNIKGQLVKDFKLNDANNTFVWDKKNNNGQPVTSGMFFYRVKSNNEVKTGKVLILK